MAKTKNKPKPKNTPAPLTEADYLAIMEIYARLNQCRTKNDLLNVLKIDLLPLFQAQAGFYIWTAPNFSKCTGVIGHVGIPDNEINTFLEMAPYNSFNKAMHKQSRSVFAHDVDFSRDQIKRDMGLFFKDNPQYKRRDYPYFDRLQSGLVTADMPEPTLAVVLNRIDDCDIAWTFREIRLMELLRPHLLQTIKTICLSAELARFQAVCAMLADSPAATALVSMDMQVVFHNQSFKDRFKVECGQGLPEKLGHLLQQEARKFEPPYEVRDGGIELPFHSTAHGTFRLSFNLLRDPGDQAKTHWLVRLKPVDEPYARMNLLAQKRGVTGRELEICVLMKDGMSNKEIAERMFVSPNTVKSHLKSIYAKFGVNNRARLAMVLHRS